MSFSKVAFSDERCFATLHSAMLGCNLAAVGCSTSRLGATGHALSPAPDQAASGRRLVDESPPDTMAKVLRSHHAAPCRAFGAAGLHAVEAC